MGAGRGLEGLEQVNRAVVHRQLRAEARTEYTLDIDATVIEAEKDAAQWSYQGVKGYTPLVGHLADLDGELGRTENGLVVGDEFRAGKVARHGGQAWLKVRGYLEELFRGIRRRSWAFGQS